MKKINKKKIILAMLIVITVSLFCTTVFAEITPTAERDSSWYLSALDFFLEALQAVGGILLKPVMMLAMAIAVIVTAITGTIFSFVLGVTNSGDESVYFIPWPDLIVFNKLASFDPNFINPAKATEGNFSLIQIMSKIISPLYFTGQTLVGGIFIILALVIGIKLAIAATAQEKAQYKTAISKWVIGLFFLMIGHFFMAGVFSINEKIVATVSVEADSVKIPVAVYAVDGIMSIIGNIAQIGLSFVNSLLPGDLAIPVDVGTYNLVEGFSGIIHYHMYNTMITQNFASLLIWFILLGQSVALAVLYFKRMFYAIFLGIIYPFTVAADTAQKIMGKSSNLLDNWIKTFVINVFTQTFHAFIMYFSMILICEVINVTGVPASEVKWDGDAPPANIDKVITLGNNSSSMAASAASILQVISLMSIVAFEKLIKEFTGIKTGRTGDLRGNGLQMVAAFKSAKGGYSNIKDNFTGVRDAQKRVNNARLEKARAMHNLQRLSGDDSQTKLEQIGGSKVSGYSDKQRMFQENPDIFSDKKRDYFMNKKLYKDIQKAAEQEQLKSQFKAQTKQFVDNNRNNYVADSLQKQAQYEMNKANAMNAPNGMATSTTRTPINPASTTPQQRIDSGSERLREIQELQKAFANADNKADLMRENPELKRLNKDFESKNDLKEFKSKIQKEQDALTKAITEENQAKIEMKKKKIAAAFSPGIALAGIGVGMGVANSIDDVFTVGGGLTTALDKAVEKSAEKYAKKTTSVNKVNVDVNFNAQPSKTVTQEVKISNVSKDTQTKKIIQEQLTTTDKTVINQNRFNKNRE